MNSSKFLALQYCPLPAASTFPRKRRKGSSLKRFALFRSPEKRGKVPCSNQVWADGGARGSTLIKLLPNQSLQSTSRLPLYLKPEASHAEHPGQLWRRET